MRTILWDLRSLLVNSNSLDDLHGRKVFCEQKGTTIYAVFDDPMRWEPSYTAVRIARVLCLCSVVLITEGSCTTKASELNTPVIQDSLREQQIHHDHVVQ